MLNEADHDADAAAPLDMLENYFDAHGWDNQRHEEEVTASVKGSWTTYELRALWRDGDSVLQFLAFPDIKVTDDRRAVVFEAMALVNEQLWVGHFELWSSSGVLLYRHAAMVDGDDGAALTLAQAEHLVETAVEECERFYPVFQFVLWGGKSPKDALAAALIDTQGEA
ncbi:YbjN domain-containing protein [Sphingomonas sp.]|uniref:YbjN domain-containing protein n=1 Tax=Sphingomonas sp. TaxID=28214 RepID=UPI003CC62F3A